MNSRFSNRLHLDSDPLGLFLWMPNKCIAYKSNVIDSRFEELKLKPTKYVCEGKEEFAVCKTMTQVRISKKLN